MSSITFIWAEPDNVVRNDEVQYILILEDERKKIIGKTTNEMKCEIGNLTSNTKYKASLVARNKAGCGQMVDLEVSTKKLGMFI